MANLNYDPALGNDGYAAPYSVAEPVSAKSLTNMTNIAGALVSLSLVAGVGVWGYKLMARDVSGIPVVRAAEGEMRVRPETPGGQLALNQGLAVNAVAAAGTAEAPADRLTLAPRATDLSEEDVPVAAPRVPLVASMQQPQVPDQAPDVAAALQGGSVDDLVNQLTAGVAPIEAEAGGAAVLTTVSAPIVAPAAISPALFNAPGVKVSLRPQLRPKTAPAIVVPARLDAPAAPAARDTAEMDSASVPAGTRLVQLGAFDSPEIARTQWTKIEGKFGTYMTGKARIVQKAQSGGRTFYRLRAHGFADLSDARRFCSALVAEGADCIPVVTR